MKKVSGLVLIEQEQEWKTCDAVQVLENRFSRMTKGFTIFKLLRCFAAQEDRNSSAAGRSCNGSGLLA